MHTNSTLRPGSVHNGSASWGDCGLSVPWRVECELISHVPTLCLHSSIVSSLPLCWVKGVYVFRCNMPSVLLAEWPGSCTCHCGNTGWNWHEIRVSTQSLLWRRNSPAAPAGNWTRSNLITSPALYQQAFPTPLNLVAQFMHSTVHWHHVRQLPDLIHLQQ